MGLIAFALYFRLLYRILCILKYAFDHAAFTAMLNGNKALV